MRMVTWFDPETGHTYVSIEAQKSGDYAIVDKPDTICHGKYDPEKSEWYEDEETHEEVVRASLLSDEETARLEALSSSKDVDKQFLANMLLKVCGR